MNILIIGAGLAGLGAGKVFRENDMDFKIFEAGSVPGGLAKTDCIHDFHFDYAGHFLHTKTEEGYKDLIKDTIPYRKVKRKSAILTSDKVIPYPIQFNLRFFDSDLSDKVVDELSGADKERRESFDSLAHFFNYHYGDTLFNLFFGPYNTKLWGTSLDQLPDDTVGNYLPEIDMNLLVKGSKEEINFEGYNNYFHYPKSGRIGSLPSFLARSLKSNIFYSNKVMHIDPSKRIIIDHKGDITAYDYLLSSIPLHEMYGILGPNKFNNAVELRYASIKNIRVALKGELLHPYHWFYVPERTVPFYRIGFPTNVAENACPDGYTSLSIEINENYAEISDEEIAETAVQFLRSNKLILADEILFTSSKLISPAYTYTPKKRRSVKERFHKFLNNHGIYMAGRYGLWEYYSMEDSYLSGKRAAIKILKNQ